jgi:hypothetical protein
MIHLLNLIAAYYQRMVSFQKKILKVKYAFIKLEVTYWEEK